MTKQEFEALVARGAGAFGWGHGGPICWSGDAQGALSELWADRHPETVLELQAAYAAAGSRILYAPTFQAQPEALAQAGWTGDGGPQRPAGGSDPPGCRGGYPGGGDLATMAGCLESWNPENFHRMTDRYRRQIGGLLEGGADLLVAETLLYPQEAEAVLLAAELEGETSLSSIASPCSQTAPFFPARRRARCSGSWRRQALQPWASTAWRRAPPCRLWCPSSAGMSGALWCPSPMRATPPSPGGPGGVSHGTGGVCPAPGGGLPHGRGPSGRLLRHHPRLPVRPPGPPGGGGPRAGPPDVRFPV